MKSGKLRKELFKSKLREEGRNWVMYILHSAKSQKLVVVIKYILVNKYLLSPCHVLGSGNNGEQSQILSSRKTINQIAP